jgi:hypothetical protein
VIVDGDCLVALAAMKARGEFVHAVVTDPPYHLTSIVKRFGADAAAPAKPGVYARSSSGFMGKTWDGGDIALRPETWRAVFDVMLPGAHLTAFGGTRTFHRMACAIEDAGFEIRDTLMWGYAQGFPKSRNIGKDIDREAESYAQGMQAAAAMQKLVTDLDKPKRQRGSRLPTEWRLPKKYGEWARNETSLGDDWIRKEGDKFSDYWRAQPGTKALKVDWFATWKNWVRNAKKPNGPGSSYSLSGHYVGEVL